MKRIIVLLVFCNIWQIGQAQVEINFNPYPVRTIPKDLLKNAHAVIRQYDLSFEVKDLSSALLVEHKIVTVLDEQGKKQAEVYFPYSKFLDIEDIEAAIYDASGKLIRNMKKKDIYDFKPFTDDISDLRVKKIDFPFTSYPYTIEYRVVSKDKNLLFYPSWAPQDDNRTAVETSSFTITTFNNAPLRYKSMNGAGNPKIVNNSYTWQLRNLNAFLDEPYTPSVKWTTPVVMTAPTQFKVDGYEGDMTSWKSFGVFLNKLREGRIELTPEKQAFVKKLVADCSDIPCKIEKIYEHLQNTTRYYSIQLGIGGWQPIAATDIDRRKYGDCKALSNYMLAMLKSVGIEGNYVVIRRGEDEREQFEDFPNPMFNHAIACVPLQNDTIWLECTSQTLPCGYLDNSNNRMALLVTPEGGRIAHTPVYDEKINFLKKKGTIRINTEGVAEVDATFVYSTLFQNIASELSEMNADFRKRYVYETMGIDNATIKDMTFKRHKARIPKVEQALKLNIEPLASKSGKRLFVPINVFSKWRKVPTPDSTRHFSVQADENGFMEEDSITFILPEGFKIENKPNPLSISKPFGSFEISVIEKSPSELIFYRKLILNNQVLPKEKYNDLVDFLQHVSKTDKTKMVLVQQ